MDSNASRAVDPAIGFLLLLLVVALASWFPSQEAEPIEPNFDLPTFLPEPERLASVQRADAALAKKHPLDEQANAVLTEWHDFGRIEAETHGNWEDGPYREATESITVRLSRYWYERGELAYRALGVRAQRQFESAVQAVLARARQDGATESAWIQAHPQDPLVLELQSSAGNFLETARRWGFVTRTGHLLGGDSALIGLHFKLRWFRMVNEIDDYTHLLDPQELRAIWRWRVSGDIRQSLESRIDFAKKVRHIDSSFPVYAVIGNLYAQQERYPEALAHIREAVLDEPFDSQLASNLEHLVDRVNRAAASPEPKQ